MIERLSITCIQTGDVLFQSHSVRTGSSLGNDAFDFNACLADFKAGTARCCFVFLSDEFVKFLRK